MARGRDGEVSLMDNHVSEVRMGTDKDDGEYINHPPYYGGDTTYEAIKVIEAWRLNFNLGNTVKYISRCEHKGTKLLDLKKAAWYLNREIEHYERGNRNVKESLIDQYAPTHDG